MELNNRIKGMVPSVSETQKFSDPNMQDYYETGSPAFKAFVDKQIAEHGIETVETAFVMAGLNSGVSGCWECHKDSCPMSVERHVFNYDFEKYNVEPDSTIKDCELPGETYGA